MGWRGICLDGVEPNGMWSDGICLDGTEHGMERNSTTSDEMERN